MTQGRCAAKRQFDVVSINAHTWLSLRYYLYPIVVAVIVVFCGAADGVARADEISMPHSLAELNAWYAEPPPGKNAATIWLEGFAALDTNRDRGLPLIGDASCVRRQKSKSVRSLPEGG